MTKLVQYVIRYGVPLVFLNVFAEQLGVPIPAVPALVVAGALTRDGKMSSTNVLIAAVIASLIADFVWYALGRRYGYRILKTLCRISLSPDSCVRDTEARFERWGLKSLLIAKFIPGVSTVAPPLAGAARASWTAFLVYDGIGALIWAGAAVAAGRVFHRAIDRVLLARYNLDRDLGVASVGESGDALLERAFGGCESRQLNQLGGNERPLLGFDEHQMAAMVFEVRRALWSETAGQLDIARYRVG